MRLLFGIIALFVLALEAGPSLASERLTVSNIAPGMTPADVAAALEGRGYNRTRSNKLGAQSATESWQAPANELIANDLIDVVYDKGRLSLMRRLSEYRTDRPLHRRTFLQALSTRYGSTVADLQSDTRPFFDIYLFASQQACGAFPISLFDRNLSVATAVELESFSDNAEPCQQGLAVLMSYDAEKSGQPVTRTITLLYNTTLMARSGQSEGQEQARFEEPLPQQYSGMWQLREALRPPGIYSQSDLDDARALTGQQIVLDDNTLVAHDGSRCIIRERGERLVEEYRGGSGGGSWSDIGMRVDQRNRFGTFYRVYSIDALCPANAVERERVLTEIGDAEDLYPITHYRVWFANGGTLPIYHVFGQYVPLSR